MFHMPSLKDMPGFLFMRSRGKQPMRVMYQGSRDVSAKPVTRFAKPEAGAIVGAAAASKAVAVAAAATKAVGPKGFQTKAFAVAAAATKAPPAVGLKGFETKAVAIAAIQAKSIAAEEDAKALEAKAQWKKKCSDCAKRCNMFNNRLVDFIELIPAKGKLALRANTHPHTHTPAHPHTCTPGHAPRVDDDVGLGESRGVFPVLTLPSDNRTGGEKGEPSSRGRHHPPAWFATQVW